MVFFTTADLLEIGGMPFVTPYEKPTQVEGLRYYRRVTETYGLNVTLGEEVRAVKAQRSRDGTRFRVETVHEGGPRMRRARNVVAAVGYYDHPNRLDVPGEDLPHVSHYYYEPHACWRKPVVIVGGKNSAAIVALELYRAGATVTLVHRRDRLSDSVKYWVKPDIENRIKEGSIAARFGTCVKEIRPASIVITPAAGASRLHAEGASVSAEVSASADALADHRSVARRSSADGQSVTGGWSAGPGALVDRERADA